MASVLGKKIEPLPFEYFCYNTAILIKNFGGTMKSTDKKKPINTIPKGVWEGSNPTTNKNEKPATPTLTTDLQG
ncbi:MAG: hypothetical protein K2G89_00210, partial [Lachnospiraceae bacterium]|nr:hypothetical protein [Lachnospiraceae bacterium]